MQEYIEDLQTLPKAGIQDLFQSRYIRSVIVSDLLNLLATINLSAWNLIDHIDHVQVGVGLMVFQQIGGINGVGFYASEIFVSAGRQIASDNMRLLYFDSSWQLQIKMEDYNACCDCRIFLRQAWDHSDGIHSGFNSFKCLII